MPKIPKKLEEIREEAIMFLWKKQSGTVEEIGQIFDLSTSAVYNIIKEHSLIKKGK